MAFKGFPILSFGGHFYSAKLNYFNNFARGSHEEHFCEIISKSGSWPRRRCRLKIFLILTLAAILFGGAEPF